MSKIFHLLVGHLIDGTGGPIKRNVLLSVEEDCIRSAKEMRPEALAKVKDTAIEDLSHCTLLPGLVDAHVHLTMSGTNDMQFRQKQLTFGYTEAAPLISKHLHQHLSHGIVAVRDGGDSNGHTLRYKLEDPLFKGYPIHLKAAGKAWHAPGRYGRLIGRTPLEGLTLAESITQENRQSDHIKIINSGLNSLKHFGKETPPQFHVSELKAAVQAGLEHHLKTMVHANGILPVAQALEAACHSIEHGFFMGKTNLEKMAEMGRFWVPTACTMKAYSEELPAGAQELDIARQNLEHQLDQIAYARKTGVLLAVGTDSGGLGIHHGASIVEELKLFIAAGFSLEGVIQCCSANGSKLIGLSDVLGEIRSGAAATFVITAGPPSCLPDALNKPERVYVNGNMISGAH
ncbi:amidohydrolase family protein [Desulforhabdus amnigena]|uniref:Amidohydrolase n=1 Tax=Desulforhabdus amnigena TaxID=40218 RepID=A0A9W6D2W8_9BACT|nr:amidohydrolase family protein [Desulforhabdus amnigena]NLJ27855.1 amidohydrolase family protein [Deltaproteobacteria bacterium]GLI33205.1 amidohydrolase [Desulforhabdus amnigena]